MAGNTALLLCIEIDLGRDFRNLQSVFESNSNGSHQSFGVWGERFVILAGGYWGFTC